MKILKLEEPSGLGIGNTAKTDPGHGTERGAASYDHVRGRRLVFCLMVSLAATVALVGTAWPSWLDEVPPPPLPDALFGLIWYTLLLALLIRPARRSRGSLHSYLARRPDRQAIRWAIITGVGLVGIGLASTYAVYLPLSYAAPWLVQWMLVELETVLISTRGDLYLFANFVNFLVVIFFGPFVEELFFRGLLLPSWASRWGTIRAVIFSSLLFGLFHVDALGGFVFGVVSSVTYLRTGSLWLPFIVHAANNGLVWLLDAGYLCLIRLRPPRRLRTSRNPSGSALWDFALAFR